MVKKVVAFFAYFFFFIMALMYFTPKSSIYFLLEQQLKQRDVVVSSEEIVDSGFDFKIEHANVSFKSIESASISEITLKIFALYNSIDLKEIVLSSTAKSFIPLHVDSVVIIYSVLDPLNVNAYAVGEFGELNAKFSIVENSLHLDLKPSKVMLKNYKNTLRNLTKTENGEFIYDKTF